MQIRSILVSSLLASALFVGCSKAPEAPPLPATTVTIAPPTTPEPAPTPTPAPEPAPTPAPTPTPAPSPELDNDTAEKDPSATDKVEPTTLESDAFDEAGLPGQLRAIVGWRDRNGTNALVLTRESPKGRGAELLATHFNREGDASWTKIRDFRELVSDCNDWRLTLEGRTGTWSVTDLDNDGIGEATFAWSAGCRTEWSPVSHKVLLVESGDKYVLRGNTGAMTFDADPAFEKAPAAFRAHAEKVWAATSIEKPPEREAYAEEAQWGNDFLAWERVGMLPLGASRAAIEEHYGKPESKDAIFHDDSASGLYFETWHYPTRGLVITLSGEDAKLADGGISSLTVTAPSDFKTRQGIAVGAPETDLLDRYGRFRNLEKSRLDKESSRYWLAIGIEWTWLTFEAYQNKVVSIRWGLGQEPPSARE